MSIQGRILGLLISTLLGTFISAQDFANPDQAYATEDLGVVTGAVLSSEGRPLSGVPVELQDANSTIVARAETAASGSFSLANVPPGYYVMTSLAGGMETRRFVDLSAGRSTVNLSFLDPAPRPTAVDATISVAQIAVPGSARKLYDKARASTGKKDYEKARDLVNQALQRQPEFAEALTLRAFLERNGHEIEAAARDCEQALQIDPYYAMAYSMLGSVYSLQGRFDDALRTLDEGVAISPRSWQMYFEMGKASIAKGLYSKGLQWMDMAERLGGYNHPEIHLVRAYALVSLKFYREAQGELQTFLVGQPKGQNAELAQQLLASLEKEEARESVQVAVAESR